MGQDKEDFEPAAAPLPSSGTEANEWLLSHHYPIRYFSYVSILSTLHISLRTINGAHLKKALTSSSPFLGYKGRGRHRMVIRGHIKNGNGTNKYLTGSRDVRKKGFPIYLNTTYDLLSLKPKRKRKLFIPSLFFLQTIPSTAIYTEKNAPHPKKVLHFSEWKKGKGKIYFFTKKEKYVFRQPNSFSYYHKVVWKARENHPRPSFGDGYDGIRFPFPDVNRRPCCADW